jgi:hypothetical protein
MRVEELSREFMIINRTIWLGGMNIFIIVIDLKVEAIILKLDFERNLTKWIINSSSQFYNIKDLVLGSVFGYSRF